MIEATAPPPLDRTRAQLIEDSVRSALTRAGTGATAIDIGCNDGRFSHLLLEWGAERVLGVDLRPANIQGAELVRDQLGIPATRLRFECADLFDLDPERLGRFDVVLMLGLMHRLENPVGALRLVRALTGSLCVVEGRLTRQSQPIVHGFGNPSELHQESGSFAVLSDGKPESSPSAPGSKLSLIPNRAALEQSMRAAGFADIEFAGPSPHHEPQYVIGDRAVVSARPSESGPLTSEEAGEADAPTPALAESVLRDLVRAVLPAGFDLGGARLLDFDGAAGAALNGLVRSREAVPDPQRHPLSYEDGRFELVWAGGLFSRLVDDWPDWMLELHRVLAKDGLLIATFLGQGAAAAEPLLADWDDDAAGICAVGTAAGRPTAYHSTWWIRAHWGRAFEVLTLLREGVGDGPSRGCGLAVLRRRGQAPTPEELETPEPAEPREAAAWRRQLELLAREDELAAVRRERERARLEKLVSGARAARDAFRAQADARD